ncbi:MULTISPECIES: hypothetical protein [Bacillus]|nr:hypothetical protein [Bacillus cereus]
MELNIHWLEQNVKNNFGETDVYTIFSLYMDLIQICRQESTGENIEKTG